MTTRVATLRISPKKALLDTTRYYYPNLVFRYYEPDFAFKDDKQAAEGAIPVPTMMAVSDSWKRHRSRAG